MPEIPKLPPVIQLTSEAAMLICVSQERIAAILHEIVDRLADLADGKPPTQQDIDELRTAIRQLGDGNDQLLHALIGDAMTGLPFN